MNFFLSLDIKINGKRNIAENMKPSKYTKLSKATAPAKRNILPGLGLRARSFPVLNTIGNRA
ncbi:hypothetical protein HS5_24100 [Acidianus sp. HS-5]|nr:hypothetical protein HS5_24100 [Acidianus sp. HS-5]